MSDDYERSITPLPETLNTPATVGFVLEQVASDLRKHEASDADMHRDLWQGITKVDVKTSDQAKRMDRIYGGLALLGLLFAIMMPVTYYAIKGVIVEELDKRFPYPVMAQKSDSNKGDRSSTLTSIDTSKEISWSAVPSAQASNK
jgi:hypothetical protein